MTPPYPHINVDIALIAGRYVIIVVTGPGIQGATKRGIHGAGVGTPKAAAVAEITAGLDGALHIPNVGTFNIGTKSILFPAIKDPPKTVLIKLRAVGATPNEQVHIPEVTNANKVSLSL